MYECGGLRSTPGVFITFHPFVKLLLNIFIVGGEGWMPACHSKCVAVRGHLAGASLSTTGVLETKHSFVSFDSRHLYLLSHLTDSVWLASQKASGILSLTIQTGIQPSPCLAFYAGAGNLNSHVHVPCAAGTSPSEPSPPPYFVLTFGRWLLKSTES